MFRKKLNPNQQTTTKICIFVQDRDFSILMGKFHNERRWYYNHGVELKFDDYYYTPMDVGKFITITRHNTAWNIGMRNMQRYWCEEGMKAVQLHRSNIDKNNKNLAYERKEYATSPKRFFRKKNNTSRYPAISSYQKLKIKNGMIKIYGYKLDLKTHEFDGMECLSYQIIDTTEKITKYTKPSDRTFSIHLQFPIDPKIRTEGSIVANDIGVINMMAVADSDTKTTEMVKMPQEMKRKEKDEIAELLSKRSKCKKNGRRYQQYTNKISKLLGKLFCQKQDYIRKVIHELLKDCKEVYIEDLDIQDMLRKIKEQVTLPDEKRKYKYGKALRRAINNSWMGYIKAWIIIYCKKNGIKCVKVDPAYTSQTCHQCGKCDKNSRNKEKYSCTNKECGLNYHADHNAAIEILTDKGTTNMPVPAAGIVVCKQKDSTNIRKSVWKARTKPIYFSDKGSSWKPPNNSSLKHFGDSVGVNQHATAVRKKPGRCESIIFMSVPGV